MRRVVVTGAGGFVGGHVVDRFAEDGWDVIAVARPGGSTPLGRGPSVSVLECDLARPDSLRKVLREGDVVIHLAGRAHVMHERAADPLAAFRAANVVPTQSVCEAAARARAAHFLFVSSAKVFGEGRDRPYTLEDPSAPVEPYGVSKAEAERVVRRAGESGAFAWTILRPPFVYGPGGKGNFPRLISLARLSMRVPLPLASIGNRRSIVFVGNLVDLMLRVARHASSCGVLLPTDARDVSTPELLREIAIAAGSRARLFPCPRMLLGAGGRLIGRSAEIERLTESLRLDSRHLHQLLGWHPPFSLEHALTLSLAAGGRPSKAYAHE